MAGWWADSSPAGAMAAPGRSGCRCGAWSRCWVSRRQRLTAVVAAPCRPCWWWWSRWCGRSLRHGTPPRQASGGVPKQRGDSYVRVREAQMPGCRLPWMWPPVRSRNCSALLQNLTAAGQLAGLVSGSALGPGRTGQRLGLMTQIRHRFRAHGRAAGPAQASGSDTPRGWPATSYPPLTGSSSTSMTWTDARPAGWWTCSRLIHLLLAVELFVVVVAVDPRWLLQASAQPLRAMLVSPSPRRLHRSRPVADDAGRRCGVHRPSSTWRKSSRSY